MKTLALLFVSLFLTACSTVVPVVPRFPDIPETLLKPCPDLTKLEDSAKLSDVAKTVTINYSTYYDCAVKHDAFAEWYKVQKHLFEKLK